MKCVPDEVIFNFLVQGGVSSKAGQVVHFNQPGLQLSVNHDIESQNLEATWIRMICTNETMLRILEIWLQGDNCFLGDILDLFHKIAHILAFAH